MAFKVINVRLNESCLSESHLDYDEDKENGFFMLKIFGAKMASGGKFQDR